jgi:hypothetical protein
MLGISRSRLLSARIGRGAVRPARADVGPGSLHPGAGLGRREAQKKLLEWRVQGCRTPCRVQGGALARQPAGCYGRCSRHTWGLASRSVV